MSFSDILKPRQEVLNPDGIQGIIDIENLRSNKRGAIESTPKSFFEITYPTSDIKYVIKKLHDRFNSNTQTPGLFLLEGLKGSGKSHLELLIYHLFKNYEFGQAWIKKNKMKCDLPESTNVIIRKFTDFPIESIWSMVFAELGASSLLKDNELPKLPLLKEALKDKKLILILDELEIGFQSLSSKHNQAQNLSFLQMMSEEAARSENASITIFASVYNSSEEPGSTLKRVPRVDIKFSEKDDKKSIILHRLFNDYHNVDKTKIENLIQGYVSQWKQNKLPADEKYYEEFVSCFPFSPELLDMLLNRVLAKNFQGNRGPLSLLGRIVKSTYNKTDIITSAHLSLKDKGIINIISDLDPGQTIIQCAQNDLKDLESLPLSSEIVSTTLLATLSATGNHKGIKDFELARQIIKPGDNYNDFTAALSGFEKLGSYFQRSEDYYFFDIQEKPYAKVEYRSLRIPANDALEFALERLKTKVFNDHSAIVFREISLVKNELAKFDKNQLRVVLSPRRLSDEERKQLYTGLENQNLVLLLEPKSDSFNAFENNDIIKWAQLSKAAIELKSGVGDNERKKQYEKIENDNAHYIDDAFKRAGFIYLNPTLVNSKLIFEQESIGQSSTRQTVVEYLQKNHYPRQIFEEHILEHMVKVEDNGTNWIMNHTLQELKDNYKKTLGFPIMLAESILVDSIKNLCIEKKIGLSHPRESYCGRSPYYSGNEWKDVRIVEPFIDDNSVEFIQVDANHNKTDENAGIVTPPTEYINSPTEEPFNVSTTNVSSINELRMKIAEVLSDKENAVITKLRLNIYSEQNDIDLSTIPSSLRGSLNSIGDMHLEISFTKKGMFSKSQIEQIAEQLPPFQNSNYKAEIKGLIKKDEENDK